MEAIYMDVRLREFKESDIPKKIEWINNPENNKYLHYDIPLEFEKTTAWFRNKDNSRRLDCVVEYEGVPVGLIGLLQIDKVNLKAEYYITIGETKYKHRGIAKKATKAILDYAFKELKLHKVYLTVDAGNRIAIQLYKESGFVQEGYFKDDLFHPDRGFIDRIRYASLYSHGLGDASAAIGSKNLMDEKIERGGVNLYFSIINTHHKKTEIQRVNSEIRNNQIYVKRDDLIPISFGGNKARKAAYFFRDADSDEYDCIVTYGSSSSNHCRIVSNMAASRGMPCYIISPLEASKPTFNSQMMELFGADITVVPVEQVHDTIERKIQDLRIVGKKPYFIAGGGHGNLGTQAYVDCYEEILRYESEKNIHFDYIFFASGTGTTQAGLVCGQLMHGDDRKIVGISIARKNPRGRQTVFDSIQDYLNTNRVAVEEEVIQRNLLFNDEYTGDGYAKDSEDITRIISEVFIKDGIPLDATYTGKAFCGMEHYIEKNQISDKNILFIHTGGTPLFFDWLRER